MRSYKAISFLLIITLLVGLFAGCGNKGNGIQGDYTTLENDEFYFAYPTSWIVEQKDKIQNNEVFFRATNNIPGNDGTKLEIKFTNEDNVTLDTFNKNACINYIAKVTISTGITFSMSDHQKQLFGKKEGIVLVYGGQGTEYMVDYMTCFVPVEKGYYTFIFTSVNEKCVDEFNIMVNSIKFK